MARTLKVYFDGEFVGRLTQDDSGQMRFQYDDAWREKPDAMALSRSLPLRAEPFSQKECRGFFGGTLPEEGNRKVIARILGISDKNDFAMLEQIGGECAGAISFHAEDEIIPADARRYRELGDDELAKVLRELPRRPLMAGEDGIRLSLAGAQDKIAVRVDDGRISIPRGSAPSSHILKPAIDTWEGVVFNEAFCMRLARACDLNTANVEIGKVEDIDYLLVERYDRIRNEAKDEAGAIRRVHQEDFCQALGVPSEKKYQSEGGPNLTACFELLREASTVPALDLRDLLDAMIFNLLIGNHDAHAKNFSLLYLPGGEVRLAPLYDLVCTVFYPELTDKMAMKIGGEAKSALIMPRHVETFAAASGLGAAQVRARVVSLAEKTLGKIADAPKPEAISEAVAALIAERCEKFLWIFRKG
jgi:serine/threonine-protein kinase HipA